MNIRVLLMRGVSTEMLDSFSQQLGGGISGAQADGKRVRQLGLARNFH